MDRQRSKWRVVRFEAGKRSVGLSVDADSLFVMLWRYVVVKGRR